MEKLNELPQAFYGVIQDGKVLMLPADDGQWLNKTTVVEAFRALERTADVNMAAAQAMRDDMYHWKQRAEAAEAERSALQDGFAEAIRHKDRLADELNELAKQEPVAWTSQANLVTLKSEQCKTLEFMTGDKSIYSNPVPLYARPAPAVSLAELVPCPYPCGWNNLLSHSMTDAAFLASGLVEDEPVSAGQRESVVLNNDRLIKVITAILRKIEEAK